MRDLLTNTDTLRGHAKVRWTQTRSEDTNKLMGPVGIRHLTAGNTFIF